MMLQFFRSFGRYFKDPLPFIKRHLLFSIFVFLINFALYFLMLQLVQHFFRALFVDDFLLRLSGRALLLRPLYLLHGILGDPLLDLFRPLVLYLTYTFAYTISTIIIGTFIGYLSRVVQREEKFPDPVAVRLGSVREFFRAIKEELLMLALSISWSGCLAVVALQGGFAPKISLALFYVFTPFIYGVYNLSYVFLRWGYSYADMWRAGARNFFSFAGFCYASAVGYFAIYFLLSALDYSHTVFMVLFGLNALFRPHGVINGTLSGVTFFRKSQKFSPQKGVLARILEPLFVVAAVLTIVTIVQISLQSRTKLELVDCDYSIQNVRLNTPDLKNGSLLQRGLRLFSFAKSLRFELQLKVKNRLQRKIFVADFAAELIVSKKRVAGLLIKGFSLSPGGERVLLVQAKADGWKVLKVLYDAVISRSVTPVLRGYVAFDLWFGALRVPLRIM